MLIFASAAMPFLIVHISIYLLLKFVAFVSFVTTKPLSHPTIIFQAPFDLVREILDN